MTRELFVSSTPHETKVGLVEDDQLAEIYLERENEYTLAGSIYKGRVTRVLPGMQSAFVDIGLERDAFLYVSDFMELSEHDEDAEEVIPTPRAVQDSRSQPVAESQTPAMEAADAADRVSTERRLESPPAQEVGAHAATAPGSVNTNFNNDSEGRERGGWRGRRRRRGRRGERMPESRFARPATETSSPRRNENYGPPPGYQPILLPGESISKYQRYAHPQPSPEARVEHDTAASAADDSAKPIARTFPEDEPLFASAQAEPLHEQHGDFSEQHEEHHEADAASWGQEHYRDQPRANRDEFHDRESEQEEDHDDESRFESMNVAFAFDSDAVEKQDEVVEGAIEARGQNAASASEQTRSASSGAAGTVEEEEIEDEEADLASYVEELEEDAAFDEMEEETQAVEGYHEPVSQEIAATGVQSDKVTPELNHGEAVEASTAEAAEEADEGDEEAELDEAQAEAEALVSGEDSRNENTEARAEVRAPSSTAGYMQRARRPEFDRHRGRRSGRRFRPSRRETQPLPLISDLLKEGQEILVQIAKEPIGKKGARITSHIALPGRFLVYMPTVNHTGVSRKISSDEERQRLKRIVMSERENGHGGFIVRTAAQGASEEELRADIRFLKNLWAEIKNRADNGKSPALIYHDLNVVERVLRDQVTSDFSAIWVDTEQEYERILRFANRFQPALVRRVKLYTKETPLFEQFGLSEELTKALKSKVWLKNGGYIVINQTEALVAIDVNTGKYVGKTARLEDTIVKTNVDAIKEIVRQIRLRDLGGIIVIDFIDMDERRNRQKVMQALEEALRGDRAPSKVLQFNDFGLVAITRKRVKQSLERTIGMSCPYCTGTGFVKSVTTVCNEIYLEMRKIARHLEHSDVMLRVNPEVAKALKNNNGKWLNELEELTKRTVIVKSDPALHQEQFDIN
jgi:Rne/Rng family ribonuclease